MWFGTQNGLNRYDGYVFKVYTSDVSRPTSISGNNIRCIFEDKKDYIWIGTEGKGLNRFNRKDETFDIFQHNSSNPQSLADNTVLAVLEDQVGQIWLGTRAGLQIFNPTTQTFQRVALGTNQVDAGNQVVTQLQQDQAGNMWIGTENGLIRLSADHLTQKVFRHNANDSTSLGNNEIHCLYQTRKGELLIGTNAGLYEYIPEKDAFRPLKATGPSANALANLEIYALEEDKSGNIWIVTFGGGLYKLTGKSRIVSAYSHSPGDPESLSNDYLLSVLVDRSGLLWIGTYGTGVEKVSLVSIVFGKMIRQSGKAQTLPSNEVYAITEDTHGALWFGTDNGLCKYNGWKDTYTVFANHPTDPGSLSSNNVYSILEDFRGDLWVGTAGGGLNQMQPYRSSRFQKYRQTKGKNGLLSDHVLALYEDRTHNLWIGTSEGINVMDISRNIFMTFTHDPALATSLSGNEVLCIREDRKGDIWVGTNKGLSRFNPQTKSFIRYGNKASGNIAISTVYSIHEDVKGYLWLGTDGGLCRLNPERTSYRVYTVKDGLPDNVVYGILEDEQQNLWVSTNKGLSKAKKQGNSGILTFINYSTQNWLHCNAFNIGAWYKSREGMLFFGCTEGVTFFQPATVTGNQYVPPVAITDFQLFFESVPVSKGGKTPLSKHISETKKIKLTYRQNVLYFEFSALNYIESEKNKYAFFMEGFDKDWNYAGHKRNATYTNLDPGQYTFRVKASNNDGVWNEKGTSVRIVITPPFYKEAWFYLICTGIGIFLLLTFVKWRTRKLQQYGRILTQKVKERTEEVLKQKEELQQALDNLKSTQSQLVEAEKMASLGILTAGVAHEINNPINFVSANVEPLKQDIEDVLQVLASYEETIQKQGLDDKFGQVEALKKQIDYEFLIHEIDALLKGIKEGASRTSEIVKGLRNFSRLDENEQKPVDVNQGIESTLMLLSNQLKSRVTIRKELGELPALMGYPGKLNQVFMNIISNAYQAIPETGEIFIRTFCEKNNVVVVIADTGTGMPEHVRKRIFEPFFTTKNVGAGTGLGLSISYGIIKDHQGTITVDSKQGKGTTFTIRLPINLVNEKQG
jgi:signal transduction histidine kinase/ligand-binding sensor domain-containing protein